MWNWWWGGLWGFGFCLEVLGWMGGTLIAVFGVGWVLLMGGFSGGLV